MPLKKTKKVFVAMSGGVDSSVAAALLSAKGWDVVGVFIKAWYPPFFPCTWADEKRDAMRVAAHLGIPFITLDLEDEYKKHVLDYMIDEYKAGRTPNPDVVCNKDIKFGIFFDKAIASGADAIATGHHVRVAGEDGVFKLLSGVDKNKDQSYFLWPLTQRVLSKTLLPVGHFQKGEIRQMARKNKLPTAEKKDSQGLCFVGKLNFKEFLRQFISKKEGVVLDIKGKTIGVHDGVYFYTIGERHGFTITAKYPNTPPLYIVEKNVAENTIVVAPGELVQKYSKKNIRIDNVNWIGGVAPDYGRHWEARIRYRMSLCPCRIKIVDGHVEVIFKTPQRAPSAGQSLVIYDGEECIGGGVIM